MKLNFSSLKYHQILRTVEYIFSTFFLILLKKNILNQVDSYLTYILLTKIR